jgi:hypothetical protein
VLCANYAPECQRRDRTHKTSLVALFVIYAMTWSAINLKERGGEENSCCSSRISFERKGYELVKEDLRFIHQSSIAIQRTLLRLETHSFFLSILRIVTSHPLLVGHISTNRLLLFMRTVLTLTLGILIFHRTNPSPISKIRHAFKTMFWCNDFGDDGVINLSDWRVKSDASIRRQTEAIALFDKFLEEKKKATVFPITEDLVPVTTHLTEPCWHTFRRHAESKGCHAKRRLATVSEREGVKERKGKMYVVSVTVPVHPSQAVAVNEEKKRQAELEAAKRKGKAQASAARKKAEQEHLEDIRRENEQARQAVIRREYEVLVADADGDKKSPGVVNSESGVILSVPSLISSPPSLLVKSEQAVVTSAPPVADWLPLQPHHAPIQAPTVSADELLGHADKVHQDQMEHIHTSIQQEKDAFDLQVEAKKRQLETQANECYKRARTCILGALPASIPCSMCKIPLKIASASCVSDGCDTQLCRSCAANVDGSYACVVCREQPESAIQNIKCFTCLARIKKGGGWFPFDTAATTTALFARIIQRNKSVVFLAVHPFVLRNVELVRVVDAVPICVIAASSRKGACVRGKVDDKK